MAIMVGTGRGALAGILIKNAESLEILEKVDTLVVDKTGTLTEGKPRVTSLIPRQNQPKPQVLQVAAALERAANIRWQPRFSRRQKSAASQSAASPIFDPFTGKGITGRVDESQSCSRQSRTFPRLADSAWPASTIARKSLESEGQTVMFVAADGKAIGAIGVSDPIKPTTAEAIDRLHRDGIRIVMLTGDSRATAESVARKLKIDSVEAQVLPNQKGEIVKRLKAEGHIVAMAGDGVNDAPALAAANVGIAMGTGTDVAIESAGITLLKGDLVGIARARALSRATMRNIRQNLFFAFAYNALGVPIAAGILYPFFGLLLSPILASAAMTFSSVSVITNALRLRRTAL